MENIYKEVNTLDTRCYKEFALSEDILMENAALGIKSFIDKEHSCLNLNSVLIVCGSGNNGADGIALARMLYGTYEVRLYLFKEPKSKQGILQLKRAKSIGIKTTKILQKSDVIVDALLGSGFRGNLSKPTQKIIKKLNSFDGYKIACDIPTGINIHGNVDNVAFKAHTTITMGAKKLSLYSDIAKDYVGDIIVANLGISENIYKVKTPFKVLQKEDLRLPLRYKHNTHKGDYGHLSIISGDKIGACVLSGIASLRFGSGLATIVSENINQNANLPYEIMSSKDIPKSTTAIAFGMGLGDENQNIIKKISNSILPMIIDADMFYKKQIGLFINKDNIILTPHPKEFTFLLKMLDICDINTLGLQQNRFLYAQKFANKYPNSVLVLKGANTIIAHKENLYINPFGQNSLSKGGSGDVLAGMIGSLLAQGYSSLDAALNGVLAHSLSAMLYDGNNYSLTPLDIIKNISNINIS